MLIYNIPLEQLDKYRDKMITIRSDDAEAMVGAVSAVPRDNLWSLQILSMDCDADALLHLPESVAMDIVLDDPTKQFSHLYHFADLTRKHPVRVSIRAVPGLIKAVKVALALNFSVKLEIDQPNALVVNELLSPAQYYLRGATVGHPVEPFHSLFLSLYSDRPTSLWSLQEEDPAVDRYVTDDGTVALSRRLVFWGISENQLADFLEQHLSACRQSRECTGCGWFSLCQGFFKVPDKSYECDNIKELFGLLNDAAMEMKQDEEKFVQFYGPGTSDSDTSESESPSMVAPHDRVDKENCSEASEPRHLGKEVLSSFSMLRLDKRLEDFTRHSWANDEARNLWEPRIRQVCLCIKELEWRSILEGVRACALTSVAPDELETFGALLSSYGLTLVPIEKIASSECYLSYGRPLREGEPFNYRCAIGRTDDAELLRAAYLGRDNASVGRLLGYPSCCNDFFDKAWVEGEFIDTTWPMAHNTARKRKVTPKHIEIQDEPSCNVLLRWLGPRKVFHLPCSFDCQATAELADKITFVARSAGFHQEMDWLAEMLTWPVEWAAVGGVAEITTPVGIITATTDVTAEQYRVSYKGAGSEKSGEQIENVNIAYQDREWYWIDNGFSSKPDMDLCHEPIVDLASETLAHTVGHVLDLGCGNGALLKKIRERRSNLIPWGVDMSTDRIAHARQLSPLFAGNFVVSSIFDDCPVWSKDREFQLVILMLGRLTEVPAADAERLLKCIKEHARNLLVYSYDNSLERLARHTGVALSRTGSNRNVALAFLDKL